MSVPDDTKIYADARGCLMCWWAEENQRASVGKSPRVCCSNFLRKELSAATAARC